ncbi:MAG: glycerophosphodiester phosphodiesterase [Dehalococcoidia bacterium]
MRHAATPGDPLIVAHRYGNHIETMLRACSLGADLVEADIHSDRGRLEVRHTKTMGPVPFLWDRWSLSAGWTPRLLLKDVLQAVPPGCEVMLDLKGRGSRFPGAVAEAVHEAMGGRPYTVCSQLWNTLVPFYDDPDARVIHSVGSAAALQRALPHLEDERFDGISIHKKFLSEPVVRSLLERVSLVMTWPVNQESELRRLQGLGVNGFIIDDLALLQRLAEERRGSSGP